MDFYISGDVAPGGRFKFSYISTAENSGTATETTPAETESTEEPTTPAETDPATDAPVTDAPAESEPETIAQKSGCQSAVMSLAAVILAMAAAVALRKSEKD